MWRWTGFDPRLVAHYYDVMREMRSWVHGRGCRLHGVAFTDQVSGSPILMSPAEQDAHVRQLADVYDPDLDGADDVFEVVNEDFQNGGIAARFPSEWFAKLLATRSTWPDGESPATVGPLLRLTSEHTPRGSQSSRKAKNLLESSVQGMDPRPALTWVWPPSHVPAIGGEPPRLQDWTRQDVASYYAIAELVGGGACVHDADALQHCRIPDAETVAKMQVASQTWADPPPADAQLGTYTRGALSDCPVEHRDRYADNNDGDQEVDPGGTRRTYAMRVGDRCTVVVNDPGPQWRPVGVNGWRVVAQRGPYGFVVDLVRG